MRGKFRALERDRQNRAWLAWHAGILSQPHKKFPSLESIMAPAKAEPRHQPANDIDLTMRRWRIALAFAQPSPRHR